MAAAADNQILIPLSNMTSRDSKRSMVTEYKTATGFDVCFLLIILGVYMIDK